MVRSARLISLMILVLASILSGPEARADSCSRAKDIEAKIKLSWRGPFVRMLEKRQFEPFCAQAPKEVLALHHYSRAIQEYGRDYLKSRFKSEKSRFGLEEATDLSWYLDKFAERYLALCQ